MDLAIQNEVCQGLLVYPGQASQYAESRQAPPGVAHIL